MEQRQINELEMLETINNFLDADTPIWSPIPIVTIYKNELAQAIDALKASAQTRGTALASDEKSLQNLKITIAEKMDILDDVLEAYADDTNNSELLAQAENSKTDYIQLADEAFEAKVKSVIELLEANMVGMAVYGLTQDQIDDAKLSFSTYQDKQGAPRSYEVASHQTNQSLENIFCEASNVLDKLDKVMKRFKRSNSEFYDAYLEVRGIVDD